MQKIILVNGPPSSGKDTLADYMERAFGAEHIKFAAPMYNAIPQLFNLSPLTWKILYEEAKEIPQKSLGNHSPREAMIWLSEQAMKPHFGIDIFGKLLANSLPRYEKELFVISDSGFAPEAQVVLDGLGPDRILLLRLQRQGCDFSQDSRSYINLDCETHDVGNDGTLDDLYKRVGELIKPFVGNQCYANTA